MYSLVKSMKFEGLVYTVSTNHWLWTKRIEYPQYISSNVRWKGTQTVHSTIYSQLVHSTCNDTFVSENNMVLNLTTRIGVEENCNIFFWQTTFIILLMLVEYLFLNKTCTFSYYILNKLFHDLFHVLKLCFFLCLLVCLFLSLFVWNLTSHLRMFHSYRGVTINREGLQNFTYGRLSNPLSSEGSLECHNSYDSGHPIIYI